VPAVICPTASLPVKEMTNFHFAKYVTKKSTDGFIITNKQQQQQQ
jgi:hypothetical protein